ATDRRARVKNRQAGLHVASTARSREPNNSSLPSPPNQARPRSPPFATGPIVLGWSPLCLLVIEAMLPITLARPAQEPAGSIRGVVTDEDFGVPLAAAQVLAVETGQKALTTDQGNYVLPNVKAGSYTLVFTKDGYVKQVKSGVVVVAGQLTEV